MKLFTLARDEAGRPHVLMTGDDSATVLTPKRSLESRNHSPSGFEWGYMGSGPAQLALAILLEVTGRDTAERLYQEFKADVIATLPKDGAVISEQEVRLWLKGHAKEEEAC